MSERVTCNVQDANLSKHNTLTKSCKHRRTVITNHLQLASLYNIHLLANITLSADVVARTENG